MKNLNKLIEARFTELMTELEDNMLEKLSANQLGIFSYNAISFSIFRDTNGVLHVRIEHCSPIADRFVYGIALIACKNATERYLKYVNF